MTDAWYFRDHDTPGWGVRMSRVPGALVGDLVVTGLDKSVAAAIAALIRGDVADARSLLENLPAKLPAQPAAPEQAALLRALQEAERRYKRLNL